VVLLAANGIEGWAAELTEQQAIDWFHRPFTRCLDCNTPLSPAAPELRPLVPEGAHVDLDTLRWCGQCRKLYWPGGHVRRMRRRLEQWRSGDFRRAARREG
jgi:uncharacterized protein with PIN domain